MAGGGKFDYRDMEKLQKQIERLESEREAFNQECIRGLAQRLLAKVVKRTPVGRPPRLDGSKTVKVKGADGKSKNGAILQKYWSGYTGGELRRGWTIGEITRVGDKYEIEVINPVMYATYVEYGHRQKPGRYVPALGVRLKKAWVPGQFMLRLSEQEVQKLAPALLEKKLEAKLKEVFDA